MDRPRFIDFLLTDYFGNINKNEYKNHKTKKAYSVVNNKLHSKIFWILFTAVGLLSLIVASLLTGEFWNSASTTVIVFICSEVIFTFIFSLRCFFVSFEEAEENKGKRGMKTLHKITVFAAAIALIFPVLEDYGVISDFDNNLLSMLPPLMAIHVIFSMIDGYKRYWQKKAGDNDKPESCA